MKTIKVKGWTWEVSKKARDVRARYSTLFEAYERPSNEKAGIWFRYLDALNKMGANGIGIASKNTKFFTICGPLEEDGKRYRFLITPSHNYIYEI